MDAENHVVQEKFVNQLLDVCKTASTSLSAMELLGGLRIAALQVELMMINESQARTQAQAVQYAKTQLQAVQQPTIIPATS